MLGKTGIESSRRVRWRVRAEEQARALSHETWVFLGNVVTRVGRHDRVHVRVNIRHRRRHTAGEAVLAA